MATGSGARLGPYVLGPVIGSGGMGEVYRAHDSRLGRDVAIKILPADVADDPERLRRFESEARAAAALNHPNILVVHDVGREHDTSYLVTELLEGRTLREVIEGGTVPLPRALDYAVQIAEGIAAAHARGIVHRDLKPENVFVTTDGRVKILDFGLAKPVPVADAAATLGTMAHGTAPHVVLGTPGYMAPEQVRGEPVDQRADIFAFGCVLYELLGGQPAFRGATTLEVLSAILHDTPVPQASLSPGLTRIVERCLEKEQAARFQSARDLAFALRGLTASTRISRRVAVAILAAAVLTTGAFLWWRPAGSPAAGEFPYPRTAVAVLPFENRSADPADAALAGGFHDELLTQLSKVAAISTRGRMSVREYAGTEKSTRQIAEELRVGSLVTASVQIVRDRLRINVELMDVATGQPLWADSYDRTLDDLFAVQSDIARQVVGAISTMLGQDQRRLAEAPTTNPEAYRLYLQAVDYVRRPGYAREPWEAAQRLYEEALALDSNFALAWAGLARVHGLMHWFRYDPSAARVAALRAAAENAVRLAPDLPEARLARGRWHYNRRDFAAALNEYEAALQRMPNDAVTVAAVGEVNRRLGNWDQVAPAFERAAQLDPRDPWVFMEMGCVCFLTLRRYGEALEACDQALRLAPDFHHAAVVKGWAHVIGYGELDTLRAAVQGMPPGAQAGSFGTRLAEHARLLLWERRPDRLLQVLEGAPGAVFEGQIVFMPTSLYAGWAHRMRGDGGAATAAFESALIVLDSAMTRLPEDWRVHSARGLALAALGRSREAVEEAEWLQQDIVYRGDRFWGPSFVALHRAQILAQTGEAALAVDEIEQMLAVPSWTSVHTLRLDPLFEPIREDPRFQALLVQYASR